MLFFSTGDNLKFVEFPGLPIILNALDLYAFIFLILHSLRGWLGHSVLCGNTISATQEIFITVLN